MAGVLTAVVAAFILLVSAPRTGALHPEQEPLPPEGMPAPGSTLMMPDQLTLDYPGSIYQDIYSSGDPDRPGIVFEWRHVPGTAGTWPSATKLETYSTSYHVTAFALADASVQDGSAALLLFVAGRSRGGETLLEQWVFPRGGSYGPSVHPVVDAQGGASASLWTLPPRRQVREIFRHRQLAVDTVMWLLPNHGLGTSLFLQFWDSRDVYSVDLSTGQLERVASAAPATNGANWIYEPNLAAELHRYRSAERSGHGYVYILSAKSFGAMLPLQGVILKDLDKDGTLDTAVSHSTLEWQSLGWNQSAEYVQMFKP
jgi:hypothetical protein